MTDKCYPEVCPLQRQGLDFSTLISFTLKKTILQYWRRNGSTISLSAIGPKRWKIFGTKYGTKSVSAQLCHQFWEIMSIGKYCGRWSVKSERKREGERGGERESHKKLFSVYVSRFIKKEIKMKYSMVKLHKNIVLKFRLVSKSSNNLDIIEQIDKVNFKSIVDFLKVI